MKREELSKFLLELENFYPLEAKRKEPVISQAVDFLLQFCLDHKINWEKAKEEVLGNYSYKSFPDMAFIRDCIQRSYIYETNVTKDEGCLMLAILPDGYIYEFIICNHGKPINEIKQRIKERFKFKECTFKTFPKGSVLIGKQVFIPIKPTKEGEEEKNKIVEIA